MRILIKTLIVILFITLTTSVFAQNAEYKKGISYLSINNTEKAESCFRKCLEIFNENGENRALYYINTLHRLGEIYHCLGREVDLQAILKELADVKGRINPVSKQMVEYLINTGSFYISISDLDKGHELLNEALEKIELVDLLDNGRAVLYSKIALCEYCKGNIQGAITNQELSVSHDMLKGPQYIQALAHYYFKDNNWTALEGILKKSFDYSREPALRKFYQSKSAERAKYWSNNNYFFTSSIPSFVYANPSPLITGIAYDAALFGKGVLLAADNKASELTLTSSDQALVERYGYYLALKRKKNKTLEEEFELQALSDVFLRYQKEHKNEFRSEFRLGWKDIANQLTDKDIAIEFITVANDRGPDIYAALCLKKGYAAPKFIVLCNHQDIVDIPVEIIYNSPELYNLVWANLEKEIEDVENIYFSPVGAFYNTGIEYLPNDDGLNISMLKNIYRLSSTKELISRQQNTINSFILYGGLNYDTSLSDLVKENPEYEKSIEANRVDISSLNINESDRGGFGFLAGTLGEVESISSIMNAAQKDVKTYSGNQGSEIAFKNMSGVPMDVLHIATHGFYFSDKKSNNTRTVDEAFLDNNLRSHSADITRFNEDKMLTRSGLILTGANNKLRGVTIPTGMEDGILYADEISNIDLSSVNLLILSACQSGLGDIDSSEGVFGLQRGFKLAGVDSILMSLWKVNDAATEILMVEMYKNLAAGQSKRDAFNNAQMSLRTVDGGRFDHPEFWAAFILLDALN